MTTPHRREQTDEGLRDRGEQYDSGTVGTVEHCLCGVAGLLCTVALLAVLYPTLVAVTQPLYVLSSTALVAIATTLWLLTWLGAEFVWEWRTGRARAEL